MVRAPNFPNLTTLKQVRQAFRLRRKGSSSSVEDDERHLVSSKPIGGSWGTSGGDSSGCESEISPDMSYKPMLNGSGRLGDVTGINIENGEEPLVQLKSPDGSESTNRKPGVSSQDKRGKDKNQRLR